uniref:Uncharacterized protein n=1 Tax=Arundo donax TaxID=35708 RepID=A0A0A9CP44_ARUDO
MAIASLVGQSSGAGAPSRSRWCSHRSRLPFSMYSYTSSLASWLEMQHSSFTMLLCRMLPSTFTSESNSLSSFASSFLVFHILFTATILPAPPPEPPRWMRYTLPEPPLPITFSSRMLLSTSDSVKLSWVKAVIFQSVTSWLSLRRRNSSQAMQTLPTRTIPASTEKSTIRPLDSSSRARAGQVGRFVPEFALAQSRFPRKLRSYAALCSAAGTSPVSLFDDRFSVLILLLMSDGMPPVSSLSDKSSAVNVGSSPTLLGGISPDKRLPLRSSVVSFCSSWIDVGMEPVILLLGSLSSLRLASLLMSAGNSPASWLFAA